MAPHSSPVSAAPPRARAARPGTRPALRRHPDQPRSTLHGGLPAIRPARLRLAGLLLCLALLATGASAASTYTTSTVDVVKVASDGRTVIARETVDYRWLQANLPVLGDGVTHYYHQGPTNDLADLWDPAESKGFEDDDMGALKGTAVRDICNRLVGGMSPGDTLEVIAADGLRKRFSYGTVYSPSARQGPMVLTWYRGGDGYVPAYWSGMKIVFFADTSTNPNGWHVFGISDMRASMPESEWYYKLEGNEKYPSTTGLAVRNVKELRIHSTQAAKTAATTVAPTKAPTATVKPTVTATGATTTTTGATGVPTTAPGTTAVPATTAPAVTTLWPDNDGGAETVTPVPSDSIGPGAITTTPTSTATPSPVPGTTSGANATPNGTGVPSPTADATANRTADATVTPVPTTYERTYEYSVSPEFGYSVFEDDPETTATTATPAPTPSPDPTATATGGPSTPVVTTVEQAAPTAPAVTAGRADRSFNRSVSFTFSVRVRESGDPALAADGALSAWLTAFLRAFAYIAGAFIP